MPDPSVNSIGPPAPIAGNAGISLQFREHLHQRGPHRPRYPVGGPYRHVPLPPLYGAKVDLVQSYRRFNVIAYRYKTPLLRTTSTCSLQ